MLKSSRNKLTLCISAIIISGSILAWFFQQHFILIILIEGIMLSAAIQISQPYVEREMEEECRKLKALHQKDGIRIARLEERLGIGRQRKSKRGQPKAPF